MVQHALEMAFRVRDPDSQVVGEIHGHVKREGAGRAESGLRLPRLGADPDTVEHIIALDDKTRPGEHAGGLLIFAGEQRRPGQHGLEMGGIEVIDVHLSLAGTEGGESRLTPMDPSRMMKDSADRFPPKPNSMHNPSMNNRCMPFVCGVSSTVNSIPP